MLLLARIVKAVTGIIVLLIVVGIALQLLDANVSNDIVRAELDAARFFVRPFRGIFSISDADWRIIVNWGLAALVYAVVGGVIATLLARGSGGGGVARRDTTTV